MKACAEAGAEAGVVDLASLNLINAALASSPGATAGDWLIVHVAPDYATLAIVRDRELIFFRTRQLEGEGDLADVVHQTAMYHEDRLGGAQFVRVVLSGVEPLDFRGTAALRDRIGAAPELLDSLAPAVGVVLRERVA
jgi:hypothetical protein